MLQQDFAIHNPSGLHVRPASTLAHGLMQFESEIILLFKGGRYNAKSVLNMLSACIKQGDVVQIIAEGSDESEAMGEITRLIASGLGE